MFYLDTSVIVSALTAEADSARVRKWIAQEEVSTLHVSDWVITEFSSALSLKLRTGQISSEYRDDALTQFRNAVAESFVRLPVAGVHFQLAAWFADRHELGLRASDALHLALANQSGLTLCTLDKRLAAAATAWGCKVIQP